MCIIYYITTLILEQSNSPFKMFLYCNKMLTHSETSHDFVEHCDVERLERATDNLSNSK